MAEDDYEAWQATLAGQYPADLPTLPLRDHGELQPPAAGVELVSASITASGDAIALWSTPEDTSVMFRRHGDGMFPDSQTEAPVGGFVTIGDHAIALGEHHIAVPSVQAFSDGRILLVGARAQWKVEGGEHNAVVFSPEGDPIQSGCVGDGINHVYIDGNDNIWVGYFDEGTVGNYGWGGIFTGDGVIETAEPIGGSGLVRFNDQLAKTWEWPAQELGARDDFDLDPWICDCYALTIADDSVWMSYYTDFPLIQITGGSVTLRGRFDKAVSSVVVSEEYAMGIGHYGMPDLVRPLRLEDGLELPPRLLTLPDGSPASANLGRGPKRGSTFGADNSRPAPRIQRHAQGPDLHVFAGTRWLRVGLEAMTGSGDA